MTQKLKALPIRNIFSSLQISNYSISENNIWGLPDGIFFTEFP